MLNIVAFVHVYVYAEADAFAPLVHRVVSVLTEWSSGKL